MATKAQLRNKVLEHLEVISAGETPSVDDQNLVEDAYDSLYQVLNADHLVTWGASDDIPIGAVNSMRDLLAYEVSPAFHQPQNQLQYIRGVKALALLSAADYVDTSEHKYY